MEEREKFEDLPRILQEMLTELGNDICSHRLLVESTQVRKVGFVLVVVDAGSKGGFRELASNPLVEDAFDLQVEVSMTYYI